MRSWTEKRGRYVALRWFLNWAEGRTLDDKYDAMVNNIRDNMEAQTKLAYDLAARSPMLGMNDLLTAMNHLPCRCRGGYVQRVDETVIPCPDCNRDAA